VEEISMRIRPFPVTADPASLSTSDRVRGRRRTTGDIPKFFTIVQVAELLDVCTRTVRRWIKSGKLIAHDLEGIIRVAESDLRGFIASRRRP
jgi:excisionase family DNA binding protein